MSLSFSHAHSQGSGTTEVVAVLIAITNNSARVLTVDSGKLLPNGPLMPLHRSLQAGVRQWVEEQTGQPLGYIEQLYTFVDTNRRNKEGHALVYVSYMGLVQEVMLQSGTGDNSARWRDWYDYFPWENHLDKHSRLNIHYIVKNLMAWANTAVNSDERQRRMQRINLCWGGAWQKDDFELSDSPINNTAINNSLNDNDTLLDDVAVGTSPNQGIFLEWVAEHALLRYEMLYEAGLLPESPDYQPSKLPNNWQTITGEPMYYDHRRVIATAISRLRAKIEYRPLIFGLMPTEFTLLQLQQSVEALSGVTLHKQNFRRLLESQNLLEPTGNSSHTGRGRPAKLFRFRFDIELQSLLMDSKLPKRHTRHK